METNHKRVTLDDFKIIGKGCKRSKFRRKLAESLHIKEKRSSLNTQEAFLFHLSYLIKVVFYNAANSDLLKVVS